MRKNLLLLILLLFVYTVSGESFRSIEIESEITSVQPMTGIVLWSDNGKNKTDAISLEYSYMKYNDIVSDINSVVSTSIDLAKLFSKEEIAALVKAGKITRGAGRVGVAVDAGLMVDAAINGDPWEWHLYNTTIGLLKTVRRWPVVGPAATMVDSYVQAGKWLWEAVKWTNTSGVDYMMHYSIFGY